VKQGRPRPRLRSPTAAGGLRPTPRLPSHFLPPTRDVNFDIYRIAKALAGPSFHTTVRTVPYTAVHTRLPSPGVTRRTLETLKFLEKAEPAEFA